MAELSPANLVAFILVLLGVTILKSANRDQKDVLIGSVLLALAVLVAVVGHLVTRKLTTARTPEADAIVDALKRQQ